MMGLHSVEEHIRRDRDHLCQREEWDAGNDENST